MVREEEKNVIGKRPNGRTGRKRMEKREREEGKRKFQRNGEKFGMELWQTGVEEEMKREIVRERLSEEVEERERKMWQKRGESES